MSARQDAIRQRITADHAACMTILRRLTEAQWRTPVPSENDAPWTARDVLAHLAVSEGGQLGQIVRCLKGEAPVPADFDLDRYNRRSVQKQADKSVEVLLQDIETGHAQVLTALAAVTDDGDFDKTGQHARGDVLTVEQFFIRTTEHRRAHAEEIQQRLQA